MKALVSIIIPTYNRAHIIGETLDSIANQTYSNWECIVVDDGSSDNTKSLLETYCSKDKRFQYYARPKNHLPGGNGSRNFGLKLSRGEYIHWFDSDDIMKPNKLELCVEAIEESKKDLVVCNFSILQSETKTINLEFDNLLKFLITDGTINTPMCFFRKEVVEGYAFNETLVRSQEFEFFTRLFGSKQVSYSVIKEPLSEIRSHEDSITGRFEKGNKDTIASMLFAKFSAIKYAKDLDVETKNIVNINFEKALWKSLIFRHKKLYWKYLNLYTRESNDIRFVKRMRLNILAHLFFKLNRGGQFIRKYFIH